MRISLYIFVLSLASFKIHAENPTNLCKNVTSELGRPLDKISLARIPMRSVAVPIPDSRQARIFQVYCDHEIIVHDQPPHATSRILNGPSVSTGGNNWLIEQDDRGEYIAITAKEPWPEGRDIDPAGDGHGQTVNHGFGIQLFRQGLHGVTKINLQTEFLRQGKDRRPLHAIEFINKMAIAPSTGFYKHTPRLLAVEVAYETDFNGETVAGISLFRLDGRRYWTVTPRFRYAESKFFNLERITSMQFSFEGDYLDVEGVLADFPGTRVKFQLNLQLKRVWRDLDPRLAER